MNKQISKRIKAKSSSKRKKIDEGKGLNYKLLKTNFIRENMMIFHLRSLDMFQLYNLLKSKGFKTEAKRFKEDEVDGMSFILIFSEEEGFDILQDDFEFEQSQIEKLIELYLFFYRLRSKGCENFRKDETPFFLCK
eukprot:TRINITY_DN703_c0_g1_i1.p1 TRINITY_DN703_c0_g1~~TRINITY_DN703_c0_g1_i1.p1  ORF type:complete len:136 (-),score=41.81 TRINITY_DN703_c0_g1_i1:101-508(-)